jgi:hypothetical protein
MTKWLVAPVLWLAATAVAVAAEEYRVEKFDNVAVPDEVSPEIASKLSGAGFKVMQGENRTLFEIWPANEWATKPGFAPSATIIDPVQPGALVGVVRLKRKGADFRGQDIASGVYTLRYANQPEDGNHVGTFETRDFLLMVPAAADTSPEVIDEMDLFKKSAESAGSTHPAIMPLVKAELGDGLPSMQHLEEQEWWAVRFAGKGPDGKPIALGLIVVGKAAE